jgi:hypothetical protein
MDSPDSWRWNDHKGASQAMLYPSPKQAIEDYCVPFSDPTTYCPQLSSCNSIVNTPSDIANNLWSVQCKGVQPNTLRMNSETDWQWLDPLPISTPNIYPSALEALEGLCKPVEDISQRCSTNPSCISTTPISENQWVVKCKGRNDNTLTMNSPQDWQWKNSSAGLTTLKSRYTSAYDALQDQCPAVDTPECSSMETCFSASNPGGDTWDIQCKGLPGTYKLRMNTPTDWQWTSAVPSGTPTYPYPTSYRQAIEGLCKPIEDPTLKCKDVSSCISATPIDMTNWSVKCKGQLDSTLTMYAPKAWSFPDQSNKLTALEAIQNHCPTFSSPTDECSSSNGTTCVSATQGITNDLWNVKCRGYNDTTLRMNYPTEWQWKGVTPVGVPVIATSALSALQNLCKPFADPETTCPKLNGGCKSVSNPGGNTWAVSCQGYPTIPLRMNSITNWQWVYGALPSSIPVSYTSASDALTTLCKPFTDPSSICSSSPTTCNAAYLENPAYPYFWIVDCKTAGTKYLYKDGNTWSWSGKTTQYSTPESAFQDVCK